MTNATQESKQAGVDTGSCEAINVDGLAIQEEFPQTRPFDEHNRRLVANVHPADWVNPTPSGRYNLIVIGAGQAGRWAAAGWRGWGGRGGRRRTVR